MDDTEVKQMIEEKIIMAQFIKEKYQDEKIRSSFRKEMNWEEEFDILFK